MRSAHRAGALALALGILAAACNSPAPSATNGPGSSGGPPPSAAASTTLRLGFQPELTQATALVGIQEGVFTNALGTGMKFAPSMFPDQASELAALTSGGLDAAYVDPNGAIAAFGATNHGIRIVSGATTGGAFLMTTYHAQKNGPELRGETLAAPGLGTTPDVALRTYLMSQGLTPGTNVTVVELPGTSIVSQYGHQIQGAWVPEEWAARMQIERDANVFVDEATLWPSHLYPTAVLVVRTAYLQANPAAVENLLLGQVIANDLVRTGSVKVQNEAAAQIKALTGQVVSTVESEQAWSYLAFTDDPLSAEVAVDAQNAARLGQIKSASVAGIYDLGPLNQVLAIAKEPAVSAG